ncbi:TonB family protein [Rhodoferax sp. GW822-FHT02A01]|uniref:energy transducer TonB n=1 Tax=Rhodoferax sp. GW822-FHT02A01 TaxID=3141537 RepID=UPI00315D1934
MILSKYSTLQLALGASLAVHGVLLSVRFVDPESFRRVFEDTPLEVILVNARTNEKSDKAKAIAQASLAGGGDAEKGRATSPLPPAPLTDTGETLEMVNASKLQSLQEQQSVLLSTVQEQIARLPQPEPKELSNKTEAQQREEKRKQLLNLLAEIERRINSENSRPKKRYISPSTREEVYAVYYDTLRRTIEDRGTENFPAFNGKKLYGELTMIVTVNFDGRVLGTEVVESSGSSLLDRRAAAIARAAGPFGPFTPAMRKQADQILVVSRFKFTRDETLQARVSSAP